MADSGRRAPPRHRQRGAGFSLLELLLAAGLGIVMTTAIAQLFAGHGRGGAILTGQARLQESARYAFSFITRSARGAGYFGCAAVDLVNGLNGPWRRVVELDIATPVAGFDGVGPGPGFDDWRPSLSTLPMRGEGAAPAYIDGNGIDPNRLRPGSDVVVFRRVAPPDHRLLRRVQGDADAVLVAAADTALDDDDFVVLSGCGQAALFRISSVAESGDRITLARAVASGDFGNRGGSLLAAGVPYGGTTGPEAAAVARVVTEIYFVARSTADNNRGQPVWSLWRKTTIAAPVELVQGIDDLQLLFGIDATPGHSRAPDRYVRAESVAGNPVRAVHISITASSVDVVTAAERPLTLTFSQTVALRGPWFAG